MEALNNCLDDMIGERVRENKSRVFHFSEFSVF